MADLSPVTTSKWNRNRKGVFVRKRGARVTRICPVCGEQFEAWTNRLSSTKTCSRKCAYDLIRARSQAYETRTCKYCHVSFQFQKARAKFHCGAGKYCSALCRNEGKVREHDSQPQKLRYKNDAHLREDKRWKQAVRERDNYTCQRCGKYDRYIHTHHVAPRSQRPDLKREVSNGKCLCASCHTWVHLHPIEAVALGLLNRESYELAARETQSRLQAFLDGETYEAAQKAARA